MQEGTDGLAKPRRRRDDPQGGIERFDLIRKLPTACKARLRATGEAAQNDRLEHLRIARDDLGGWNWLVLEDCQQGLSFIAALEGTASHRDFVEDDPQ